MVSQNPTSATTNVEVTDLRDAAMGSSVGFNARSDPTRDNIFFAPDASLANFFARPIVAATYTWTPSQASPFTAILNPWTLFFGNKRVVNRINNYSQMRANLHVRFMINGNGFYYGRLLADYAPLSANDQMSSYSTLITQNLVQASQRMKVFIDPGDCCTQEMYLPFVWHVDSISIASAEWSSLGQIYIRELTGLKHANASVQPVTITVMVWATDVRLALPTSVPSSALVVQAGEDEYADPGPVQSTATAVAKVASKFADLPVIGPYARATSIAAGAASKVAGMFGLSRPCIIEPNMPMRPTFISSLAPADAGDNVQKLTVDSKQEIALDPSTIGIDLPDELSISGIAARESYLTSFPWTTSKVAGNLLWNTRVGPNLCILSGGSYYLPAPAFAAYPFEYWRGKMRLRFQIVASGYHRGRARIVWDPVYPASLEANIQYTRVVDISDDRDVTIEIDWGQAQHFLGTDSLSTGATAYSTTAITTQNASYNGVLGFYVFNDLATPNSTVNNDIQVNVFVSFTDFQVASPIAVSGLANSYAATVQAGEEMESSMDGNDPGCGEPETILTVGGAKDDPNDMAVYFGERIASFRQMLRRYTLYYSLTAANPSAPDPAMWPIIETDVPIPYGYNTYSPHLTSTGGKFNYVGFHWLTYLAPAFACMRGAQRSKYVTYASKLEAIQSLAVSRNIAGSPIVAAPTVMSTASQSSYGRASLISRGNFTTGTAITPSMKQPVLEVEFPYQKAVRYDEARIAAVDSTASTSPYEGKHGVELYLAPGVQRIFLERYVSVGEDFNLLWFQGCPPLVLLNPPAA